MKPARKELNQNTTWPFVWVRDRPIWLFWGRYWYISDSWTDTDKRYFQNY